MITLLACLAFQDELTADQRRAVVHLGQLYAGVHLFKEFNGDVPRQLSHLVTRPKDAAVWPEGGFLLGPIPKDPWGNEFEYDPRGDEPRIWTWGSDGKPGGEGGARDLDLKNAFRRAPPPEPKPVTTMARMGNLASAIEMYYLDRGRYPESLDALKLPIEDAWGNRFVYRVPGTGDRKYDLLSLGEDGKEGTDDDLWQGGKPVAKKKSPFTVDAWASWNALELGAEVEFVMEGSGFTMTITKKLSKKEGDRITLSTVTKFRVGDQDTESPGEESVQKMSGASMDGACPLCSKRFSEHKDESKWSKEKLKVGDRELECDVMEPPDKDCRGEKVTYRFKMWYSTEVPGQMVRMEADQVKMWVTRYKK